MGATDDVDLNAGVYDRIARKFETAKIVPVLGAGANLCGRPSGESYRNGKYLPSGRELTSHLVATTHYPDETESDLARVSQYMACTEGSGSLYEELRRVFRSDYSPTVLHHFLADRAAATRRFRLGRGGMLFVTTNYDDALERAFDAAGEPYDLLVYVADGDEQGSFRHIRPGSDPVIIDRPNKYAEFDLSARHLIAKIHGAVDAVPSRDSYVITEDDYVDYIARLGGTFLPMIVAELLRDSHLLFLGYSLRDWNFRAMLHRLWGLQQGRKFRSWAIEAFPDLVDSVAWRERGVDIVVDRLEVFVASMQTRFPPAEPGRAAG